MVSLWLVDSVCVLAISHQDYGQVMYHCFFKKTSIYWIFDNTSTWHGSCCLTQQLFDAKPVVQHLLSEQIAYSLRGRVQGWSWGWMGGWSLFAMRKPCRRSTNFRIILHKKQWRTDSVESRNQNSPNLHPLNTRWTRIPNAALLPLQRVRVWRPWANGAQGFKPIATQIPFTYERLQNRTIREVALALIPGDV